MSGVVSDVVVGLDDAAWPHLGQANPLDEGLDLALHRSEVQDEISFGLVAVAHVQRSAELAASYVWQRERMTELLQAPLLILREPELLRRRRWSSLLVQPFAQGERCDDRGELEFRGRRFGFQGQEATRDDGRVIEREAA